MIKMNLEAFDMLLWIVTMILFFYGTTLAMIYNNGLLVLIILGICLLIAFINKFLIFKESREKSLYTRHD